MEMLSSEVKPNHPPEPTTVEVLREHVAFLRELLEERNDYWKGQAGRLREEADQLRESNAFLRAALAEAAVLAVSANDDPSSEMVERWGRLCHT